MSAPTMVNPHPQAPPFCWSAGMTEAQFFNANLMCGQRGFVFYVPNTWSEWFREFADGCGAATWRVIRLPWMHRGQRQLQCLRCGAVVEVEMPDWSTALREGL